MPLTRNKPVSITTGVHSGNSIQWLWEEESIDLAWEQEECLEEEIDCSYQGDTPRLYGKWKREKNHFTPVRTGEYSAIYNPDSNTLQVLFSKYAIRCHPCSPCFPGQGDVDSDGNLWAYCLPPEMMTEEWQQENSQRIFQRRKSRKGNYYWKKLNKEVEKHDQTRTGPGDS